METRSSAKMGCCDSDTSSHHALFALASTPQSRARSLCLLRGAVRVQHILSDCQKAVQECVKNHEHFVLGHVYSYADTCLPHRHGNVSETDERTWPRRKSQCLWVPNGASAVQLCISLLLNTPTEMKGWLIQSPRKTLARGQTLQTRTYQGAQTEGLGPLLMVHCQPRAF